MEKDKIFQSVQKALSTPPLILVGTGGTIPHGISGMEKLAEWLIKELDGKYSGEVCWKNFSGRLRKGIGLESALTDLNMPENILDDIVLETWKLVSCDDLLVLDKWLTEPERPVLGKLIYKFYLANPQCVNIITTNYDRLIEYSCDQYHMPINLFFEGEFIKRMRRNPKPASSSKVNILKVHGSLDWYYNKDNQVVSLPLQKKIPCGCRPAMVTPGTAKYKKVLESPFRDIVHVADELMEKTQNYLCIGYGFNDTQIQNNIIEGIQMGKAIVVVTMKVSEEAKKLIQDNSDNYIIIQASGDDNRKTEFIMHDGTTVLDGVYWTQEGLCQMF